MARTKQDVATAAGASAADSLDKTVEGGIVKRGRGRPRLTDGPKKPYAPTGRPRGRPKGSTKQKGAAVLASTTPTKPKPEGYVERRGRPRKSDATTPKSTTTTPKRRGRPSKKASETPVAAGPDANGEALGHQDAPFDADEALSVGEDAGRNSDFKSPGSEELGEGVDMD